MTARRSTKNDPARTEYYESFLDFFYQVHYLLGMTLEEKMCDGVVSRTQAAVLWLLASEIGDGGIMRRKDVELRLRGWFETSNSNVSKILRDLTKPPHKYIVQKENPDSGREKIIALTAEGKVFAQSMRLRGIQWFEAAFTHMSAERMANGRDFFTELFSQPFLSTPMPAPEKRVATRRNGSAIRRRRS